MRSVSLYSTLFLISALSILYFPRPPFLGILYFLENLTPPSFSPVKCPLLAAGQSQTGPLVWTDHWSALYWTQDHTTIKSKSLDNRTMEKPHSAMKWRRKKHFYSRTSFVFTKPIHNFLRRGGCRILMVNWFGKWYIQHFLCLLVFNKPGFPQVSLEGVGICRSRLLIQHFLASKPFLPLTVHQFSSEEDTFKYQIQFSLGFIRDDLQFLYVIDG